MPKKILLIEDDPFLADIYLTSLRDAGYETKMAKDGEKGLKMAEEMKPDLILLDLLLPGMDGFEVLSKIRKNPSLSNIPVVILTNYGEEENVERAKILGASGFLLKIEFTPKELIKEIKKYL